MRSRSALAVLGLDETTGHSVEEVKAAYRRQVKLLHPDAGGSAEGFCELHEAYYASLRRVKKTSTDKLGADRCDDDVFFHGSNDTHFRWNADHFCRARANKSTRDFYRPYNSDPFAHGFTAEEVLEAERRNRLCFLWFITKHGLLWGGLVYFVFVYLCENRIYRAIQARKNGHDDAAYWEKVRKDERLGLTTPPRPHWTDVNSEEFLSACGKETAMRRRRALMFGGAGGYSARPVALTFQGRPFTFVGVRGARNSGVPKTAATYESDVHYELDGFEED